MGPEGLYMGTGAVSITKVFIQIQDLEEAVPSRQGSVSQDLGLV